MGYRILHRTWKSTKAMYILMFFELAGLISILVLFGLAQPNLYRTQLWRVGYELGFNSSPSIILYAYANHRPLPTIPLVWSQTLTNFNVAISIVVLFFLLAKLIMFIMKVWYPLLATVVNCTLVALFAVSAYGQAGPDYGDPKRPSASAWYLRNNCNIAAYDVTKAVKSCQMAQGTFAATTIMLALFVVNLTLSIWSMLPNAADKTSLTEKDGNTSPSSYFGKDDQVWEMQPPQTPRGIPPYTPRTMAFNTLERKLPFRA